jgi:hypothetical protein
MLAFLQLEQGKDSYSLRAVIEKHLQAQPTRAAQIMLAVELGCVEGGGDFERKGWGGTWEHGVAGTAAYLTRLDGWGYKLTEIEQLVVAEAKKGKKGA